VTASTAPSTAERGGPSLSQQALDAQAGLLPYALIAFVVSLPIYVWVGGHAPNAAWMSASFVIFAIAWGVFYGVVNWLKEPAAKDLKRRARVQLMAGLMWAGATAHLAAFAESAGPLREMLLMLSLAAGVMCVVFTAPWLPSLLIVGPAAVAGPLFAFTAHRTLETTPLAWGGTALAFALAFLVNRILRKQFALSAERETLMAERSAQADAARRLARSKSDLVATLSDEIRNGLTGVAHVLASAAGRGSRTAPSREQLAAGLDAVNELLSVLNTTLDAETAEAGRLSVQPQPIDLAALCREAVLAHRAGASAKGIELALHMDPDLAAASGGAAIGDPQRVRQVLAALVGNAVKFTLRGRVEARITLTSEGRLTVAVADTGPGLTDDELQLAFQPFQRIARTSAGIPGAGLGLTLARQLARLMGGDLRAHSAVGVGSCFTLELPYQPEARAPVEEPAMSGLFDPSDRPRLRVLIAEDDSLAAASLRNGLEQLGHKVVQAADGRRAVELTRVCDFDVLMVAASASAEGPQIMAEIRRLEGAAGRTPIVALIGGDPEEAAQSLAAGASGVLRKPFSTPALARALADALAVKACANDREVA
jgi:signal transduction histidine kinase/CheY-like chemotaxis protein